MRIALCNEVIAPMSFLTYDSTRPWAKAMKAAVISRKMPPWFADPQIAHYSNDQSLAQHDIDTISQWADSGATQGDPKDAPAPIQWPANGWTGSNGCSCQRQNRLHRSTRL